ncbi:hypothetical protein JAAARDRAFT_35893 [Jaapia argillacea MUCL 33604]|uniref:Cytochrome P450 n=1 Tax=Jaapia argillacea MUCL 33604 TaxID=933084 RepID=A0A067Q3V4_9AGAM|nr:hypothetical protein JAAARDRAFT_35893 [Jaapia argillacea MUCL 33604]
MSMTIITTVLFLSVLWLVRRLSRIGRRKVGLPPGPPTAPLLGNLHIFPTEFAHYKFTEWAQVYGDVYSLKIGPGTAIVISSAEAVRELMDKRSATTVDRPPNFMADAVTGGLNMVLARYTEEWRILRRTASAVLTPNASARHLHIQRAEAAQLMYDLLQAPQGFYTHIRRYANSVMMSILYGKRCPRYETREATAFFHVQHLWEAALEPGAHPPVDLLPFLRYIPERWAPWKKLCKEVRKLQRELYFGLLGECEDRVWKGEDSGCFMDEVVLRQEEFAMSREMTGYLGGVLIEGGSDTTSSFLQTVVLALTAFPETLRKAQEEIDRVVGPNRLPTPEDIDHLPYIQAIIKETHRFRPVAPLAVPHCTLAFEEYRGFLIPEGTTIFVNTWGIYHDPKAFDEPEVFNPDRYIASEYGTKPAFDASDFKHTLPFGSGRRICPGIHVANNSLIVNTMNLIWGFNFSPPH